MKRLIILLIPFIFIFASCSERAEQKSLSILAYNMYLMFDDVSDGDEYYPFTRSGGYGEDEYRKRIALYQDFLLSDDALSDIYILSEVESEKVLLDLMSGKMSRKGFKYYGILDNNSPISVGFISRIPIFDVKVHSNNGPRDIIEIDFIFNGSFVSLFALHAKSRVGGGEEERMSTFEHLSFLMRGCHPSLAIAAGDFNEDPRTGPYFIDALADPDAPLTVSGDEHCLSPGIFYCPSLDEDQDAYGTYYYEGRWYSYDNILLSLAAFDSSELEHLHSTIVYPPDGVDPSGVPVRYDIITNSGYSDHLAVKTTLGYY